MRRAWIGLILAASCATPGWGGRGDYYAALGAKDPGLARLHFTQARAALVESLDTDDLGPVDALESHTLLIRCLLELERFAAAEDQIPRAAAAFRKIPVSNVRGDPIGLHLVRATLAWPHALEDSETEMRMAFQRRMAGSTGAYVSLVFARLLDEKGKRLTQTHPDKARAALDEGLHLCNDRLIRPSPLEQDFRKLRKAMEEKLSKIR